MVHYNKIRVCAEMVGGRGGMGRLMLNENHPKMGKSPESVKLSQPRIRPI